MDQLARAQADLPFSQRRQVVHDLVPRLPPRRGRPSTGLFCLAQLEVPQAMDEVGAHMAGGGRSAAVEHTRGDDVSGEVADATNCWTHPAFLIYDEQHSSGEVCFHGEDNLEAYVAFIQEVQGSRGRKGGNIYRRARRTGDRDSELTVCVDRGPMGETRW